MLAGVQTVTADVGGVRVSLCFAAHVLSPVSTAGPAIATIGTEPLEASCDCGFSTVPETVSDGTRLLAAHIDEVHTA